jgi:hypothetical protein
LMTVMGADFCHGQLSAFFDKIKSGLDDFRLNGDRGTINGRIRYFLMY